jgi:hypothetical protein
MTTDPKRLAAKMIPNVPIPLNFPLSGPPRGRPPHWAPGALSGSGAGVGEVTGRTPM